jgi:prefoldin subunit 5
MEYKDTIKLEIEYLEKMRDKYQGFVKELNHKIRELQKLLGTKEEEPKDSIGE